MPMKNQRNSKLNKASIFFEFLQSGVRPAPTLIIGVCFLLLPSLITFHCRLHHPSPPPPPLALVLHSLLTPTKSLFTQSSHLSLGLPPLLLHTTLSASALFVDRSSSIHSTCIPHHVIILNFTSGSLSPTCSLSSSIYGNDTV